MNVKLVSSSDTGYQIFMLLTIIIYLICNSILKSWPKGKAELGRDLLLLSPFCYDQLFLGGNIASKHSCQYSLGLPFLELSLPLKK